MLRDSASRHSHHLGEAGALQSPVGDEVKVTEDFLSTAQLLITFHALIHYYSHCAKNSFRLELDSTSLRIYTKMISVSFLFTIYVRQK